MAIKKSELYSSLWKSCDELRGGMDASQYKDYVLVLLFVKYVSDKAKSQKHYDLVVPKGGRFDDIVALKGAKDIGDKMNKVIAKLAAPNELTGVITVADWCDVDKLGKDKEMVDRLSNLVGLFQGLDFGGNRADRDDLLGDAYEYLMRHFATESGKSKGQFYTPAEVSRIIAKVIGLAGVKDNKQTIHDPTCGSEAEAASATQAMEELAEENSGEDGVFEELKTEKGKIQKATVAARLKEIQKDRSAADERKVLSEYLSLIEKEAALNTKAKSAQEALLGKVLARYGKLTEEDIKSIVVDDKWMTAIEAAVQGELDRVSQTLPGRLRELAERHASPLPQLTSELEALAVRVEAHLNKMGVQW